MLLIERVEGTALWTLVLPYLAVLSQCNSLGLESSCMLNTMNLSSQSLGVNVVGPGTSPDKKIFHI